MKKIRPGVAHLVLASLLGTFAQAAPFSVHDAGVQLSAPVSTNGQLQFTLTCESGVTYFIEHSADLQIWAPILTNSDPAITRLVTTDGPDNAGFYRASRTPLPLFAAAIAAVSNIDLRGNDLVTDGFDSGDPRYSTNGLYPVGHPEMTTATGDVCTDSALVDSLIVGNANIKGSVKTGPGTNTISIGANGSVGDVAWVNNGNVGIQPGHSATDFNVVFPDVTLPAQVWLPKGAALPGQTINGVSYSYVFNVSGDYQINNLNGNVYVNTNAHVRLKILNSYITSSQVIRLDTNNAYLQVFMVGDTFSLGGAAVIDNPSGHAERFFLFGLPNCTTITFGGNGNFYGGIYAPEAEFDLGGGGSATYDFVGATVTKSVIMNGHYSFHYDENLARIGPTR